MKKLLLSILFSTNLFALEYVSTNTEDFLFLGYKKFEIGFNGLDLIGRCIDCDATFNFEYDIIVSYLVNQKNENKINNSTYIKYTLVDSYFKRTTRDTENYNFQFLFSLSKDFSYKINNYLSFGINYNLFTLDSWYAGIKRNDIQKESYITKFRIFDGLNINLKLYLNP